MTPLSIKKRFVLPAVLFIIAATSYQAAAAITVDLAALPASPQPVGTTISLTATATDSDPGTISFRFSAGPSPNLLIMMRDYSTTNTFQVAPAKYDGTFQIQVTARNNATQATAQATISFQLTSRLSGSSPVVSATANPLIALFSAPSCSLGSFMQVRFWRKGTVGNVDSTGWLPCVPPASMNFYVAGMRADSVYYMRSETVTGLKVVAGPTLAFQTGIPTVTFPPVTFPNPPGLQDSLANHVLLETPITVGYFPVAFDLSGYPIWYYQDPSGTTPLVTGPVAGGTILLLAVGTDLNGMYGPNAVLREIDLTGNVIHETNAARVSEQVVAMGQTSSCQLGSTQCLVGSFTHDAIRLKNGHTVVLAVAEKVFTDGTQGSSAANPVDIVGDMIIDLDTNWQVAWFWNSFDHLDVNRAAVLGETCRQGQGGCPPLFLGSLANDWLHGNSIDYVSDGSLVYSARHQDWVFKIDYNNGTGTGDVVWKLGKDGDFTINSSDPYPWFSHQHDVGFELNGTSVLSMFDNGNTRHSLFPTANSRGYVLNVDQTTMTATPMILTDLGVYSQALGSASLLLNGDYHFLAGIPVPIPGPYNQSIEVRPDGSIGMIAQVSNTIAYRSFRMLDLYKAPVN